MVLAAAGAAYALPETHIVQKGDSLWKIANQYGTSVNTLKALNNLTSDNLRIGQQLILSANQAGNTPPVQATADSPDNQGVSEYIVKSGDNLWSIALKYGTTVEKLKEINKLTTNDLKIGDKLVIPNLAKAPQPSRSGDSADGSRIIAKAAEYLGTPYRYGGASASGFDCSGFTQFVYSEVGIKIKRTSAQQYENARKISFEQLQKGDLVFFSTNSGKPDHVGIYIGDKKFIHAPSKGKKIQISSFENSYWKEKFHGAGTYL